MQRLDALIEVTVGRTALIVIFHDIFQSLETAIVHVRRGTRDLAQGRRLEYAPVFGIMRYGEAADVRVRLIGADAEIGVHVTREVHALMAGIALGFVEKNIITSHLRRSHGGFLA